MHCSQVTDLLSEYVDDALDPSTRAHVEEHLAHCRTCTAELASLRTYLEAMGSLPQVQAPADFLASVHERLEQPGLFKRLLTWLFFPWKVKLPFEAAGLVAASLLVVLLYRGTDPEKAQLAPVSPAPSLQAPAAPPAPAPTASDFSGAGPLDSVPPIGREIHGRFAPACHLSPCRRGSQKRRSTTRLTRTHFPISAGRVRLRNQGRTKPPTSPYEEAAKPRFKNLSRQSRRPGFQMPRQSPSNWCCA